MRAQQAEDEAEEIGPPALGEGGDIVVGAPRRVTRPRAERGSSRLNARRPSSAPVPISTPSGTLSVIAGSAARCHHLRGSRAWRASTSASGTSKTSSSWTCISILVPVSPSAASAGPIRAIARLMMSALVPWIGALIAARSAPCRSCWTLDLMRGKCVLRPNRVVVKPVSRAWVERVADIGADAREALEIAVDHRLRLVRRDLQPLGEAPARDAVEDREVDRLRAARACRD